MAIYKCLACGHIYDEDIEGVPFEELSDDWACPTCSADKSFFDKQGDENASPVTEAPQKEKPEGEYLAQWKKTSDDFNNYLNEIQSMAENGESISEAMKTRIPVISWDDVLIKGAQLSKIPLNKDADVNMRTVIGPQAKHPLMIESPVYISHMSFGALSKEIKEAMARGSHSAQTCLI
jgi:rubredoxin